MKFSVKTVHHKPQQPVSLEDPLEQNQKWSSSKTSSVSLQLLTCRPITSIIAINTRRMSHNCDYSIILYNTNVQIMLSSAKTYIHLFFSQMQKTF